MSSTSSASLNESHAFAVLGVLVRRRQLQFRKRLEPNLKPLRSSERALGRAATPVSLNHRAQDVLRREHLRCDSLWGDDESVERISYWQRTFDTES